MKAPSRRKEISVTYKGWTYVQTPWGLWDGKLQYAKALYDPDGKERMHAGYSKFIPRKKMKPEAKRVIDLLKRMREIENETD